MERLIQKLGVDKDGNGDIYLRLLSDLGLDETRLIEDTVSQKRLLQINPSFTREARKVSDMNKSERHIRGGMAAREKYLHQQG